MVKKKVGTKKAMACSTSESCPGGFVLAILIVVLVWVSQATWSKIAITVLAALVVLSGGDCMCKGKK